MIGSTEPISEADIVRPDFRIDTLAARKNDNPEMMNETASDYAGITTEANRRAARKG